MNFRFDGSTLERPSSGRHSKHPKASKNFFFHAHLTRGRKDSAKMHFLREHDYLREFDVKQRIDVSDIFATRGITREYIENSD